jgi:uncharacterized membrane protein
MHTSIFLASLLGPLLLVIGVSILVNRESYTTMAAEFIESRPLLYIAGVTALLGGWAIVLTHNVWTADWRVIITLLGWIATFAGVYRLMFPDSVRRIGSEMFKSEKTMLFSGIAFVVLGAILCFAGFLH